MLNIKLDIYILQYEDRDKGYKTKQRDQHGALITWLINNIHELK